LFIFWLSRPNVRPKKTIEFQNLFDMWLQPVEISVFEVSIDRNVHFINECHAEKLTCLLQREATMKD